MLTDRAAEVFFALKMDQTDDRNAVLVYIAFRDRQLAVSVTKSIHRRLGQEYWNQAVKPDAAAVQPQRLRKGYC